MADDKDDQRQAHLNGEQNGAGAAAAPQSAEQKLVKPIEAFESKTEELPQANRRLRLLNQLSNSMILGDNAQEQLNAAFDIAAEELGAKYYFNYRTDDSIAGALFLESARGLEGDEIQALRQIRFGQYLCGQVAESRHPVIVENVHLLFDKATAGVRAMGITAYAGVPLIAHGHLLGTIAIGSTRKTHFTSSDIDFLKTIADQSAAMLDRTRLLESVRENEALLTDFFENATMGLHWVGPDGIILRANKAELALLGYSRDEYVGHHIAEFHASKEAIDDILTRLSRDENLTDYEAELRCKDGSLKSVRINSSALWKDGKFVHSRCFTRDITERKRTAEMLRQSEAKFRATFENAAVGIAHVAPDGTWLDVNHRLCEIVGYSRDEIVGKTFQDVTHPDDLEADLDYVTKLLKGSADSYMMEKRYICKDGAIVWANLTVACVRNRNGKIDYFVSVVEDISARKAAERALRESADRVRHALAAGGLGAWELDLATQIAHGDDRIRSMFGRASGDITQVEFLSLIHNDDVASVQTALARAADPQGNGHFEFEYRIRRQNDGAERWMNSQGQAIFQNRRPVRMIGVTYDMTERKRAEDHIKLLMREVNHRSKNLLTVVQAVARQTARKSDPSTFVVQLSERIDGLAASQDLLVKNLWQGVDVAALVEAQLSHFKDLIGTRIVADGPPVGLTPAAAQGVGMALHELATNAAKYGALSNHTGRVTINWHVAAGDPPEFQMTWIEEGGPPVQAPNQSGFGQMVIGRMAEAAVSGTAEIDYRQSGLIWKLTAPADAALELGIARHSA